MNQREHDRDELRPLGEALPGVDPALEENETATSVLDK